MDHVCHIILDETGKTFQTYHNPSEELFAFSYNFIFRQEIQRNGPKQRMRDQKVPPITHRFSKIKSFRVQQVKPQTQQQILKGLQAQGFAESLDQKRKRNAGDTVSGMKFPTNNNATVITAKVVGGGPQ